MYQPRSERSTGRGTRAARLLDAYAPLGLHLTRWDEILQPSGLCNIPASVFLRPVSDRRSALEQLRLRRLLLSLDLAARSSRIFHLWWHPHNFGRNTPENLAFLRTILQSFARHREHRGMRSLSMVEVAAEAKQAATHV
jgi:hypothetical protein